MPFEFRSLHDLSAAARFRVAVTIPQVNLWWCQLGLDRYLIGEGGLHEDTPLEICHRRNDPKGWLCTSFLAHLMLNYRMVESKVTDLPLSHRRIQPYIYKSCMRCLVMISLPPLSSIGA